jgi:transcriptional regulator with XRE-family HTH domain
MRTSDEELAILGATVRAARKARGLTQQGTAKAVDVSRAQLAGLERGANVSVKFLLKVAHHLELFDIPLDGKVRITSGQPGVNIVEVLHVLDLSDALIEYLRATLIETILPSSERSTLKETPALKEFVARHTGSAEGLSRLGDALLEFSRERPSSTPPRLPEEDHQVKDARRSRRRTE